MRLIQERPMAIAICDQYYGTVTSIPAEIISRSVVLGFGSNQTTYEIVFEGVWVPDNAYTVIGCSLLYLEIMRDVQLFQSPMIVRPGDTMYCKYVLSYK